MKIKLNNKYIKWGLTFFLTFVACAVFYYLFFHWSEMSKNFKSLMGILKPVVVGLVIAYLLTPILNFLEVRVLNPLLDKMKVARTQKRDRIVRVLGVIFTTLFIILLLYALVSMLVSQIVPSIQNIVSNFDTYVNNVSAYLNKVLEDNRELKNYLIPQINKISVEIENWLSDTASLLAKSSELLKTVSMSIIGFVKALWNFVIGFIIAIYMLSSKETFSAQGKKIIYAVFEQDTANSVLKSLRFVHRTFIGFLSGKVVDSIIIGLLCFIGTTIMRTPYAVLVSVIVGFTNIIPFFGPYLGAIPSAILILVVDLAHPLNCLYFIIFILILQQVDGNIIGPKILASSTGLSGFWVIFAITIFGGLMGIPGMIVGVPLFAVFYAAVKHLIDRSLNKKALPVETATYQSLGSIDEDGVIHSAEEEWEREHGVTRPHAGKKKNNKSIFRFFKREKKKNADSAAPGQNDETKE